MANRKWPQNDYSLESSLMFGLPEILGFMDQKDVWVHVNLINGIYVPINAIYLYSSEMAEWPKIFYEGTQEEPVVLKTTNNITTSIFGIIYSLKNVSYSKGTFCITFSGWKNNTLTQYYTEKINFDLETY